ncbi:MAG: exonuclease, partial [candidate division NC10 bacterium]|nr:exonuclease [candidate division NC10 bacterium]
MRGYLDIETSFEGAITVIGLYADDRGCIQLVGPQVTEVSLYRAVGGLRTLCTYSGSR